IGIEHYPPGRIMNDVRMHDPRLPPGFRSGPSEFVSCKSATHRKNENPQQPTFLKKAAAQAKPRSVESDCNEKHTETDHQAKTQIGRKSARTIFRTDRIETEHLSVKIAVQEEADTSGDGGQVRRSCLEMILESRELGRLTLRDHTRVGVSGSQGGQARDRRE